jgi:hypothetical protein
VGHVGGFPGGLGGLFVVPLGLLPGLCVFRSPGLGGPDILDLAIRGPTVQPAAPISRVMGQLIGIMVGVGGLTVKRQIFSPGLEGPGFPILTIQGQTPGIFLLVVSEQTKRPTANVVEWFD